MTDVHQAVNRPSVVMRAIPVRDGALWPGAEALILTSPLDTTDHPEFLHLAAGWTYNEHSGTLTQNWRAR